MSEEYEPHPHDNQCTLWPKDGLIMSALAADNPLYDNSTIDPVAAEELLNSGYFYSPRKHPELWIDHNVTLGNYTQL